MCNRYCKLFNVLGCNKVDTFIYFPFYNYYVVLLKSCSKHCNSSFQVRKSTLKICWKMYMMLSNSSRFGHWTKKSSELFTQHLKSAQASTKKILDWPTVLKQRPNNIHELPGEWQKLSCESYYSGCNYKLPDIMNGQYHWN